MTLAGLINALRLVDQSLPEVNTNILGTGTSETTIARISLPQAKIGGRRKRPHQ